MGCEKIWKEQTSSIAKRDALTQAIEFCREGDVFVVTKLDRLARSVRHLGELIEALEERNVGLRVLSLGLDTTTATGKLMLNVLGSVAQFEREMMLERQREGIQKAKKAGKYRGRAPTAQRRKAEAQELLRGGMSKRDIAATLGISERSVHRIT
ncbi:recombinase family protein [Mameliella sp. CS4]|nr:recombinase family protein [Mameliella sp. CS4]